MDEILTLQEVVELIEVQKNLTRAAVYARKTRTAMRLHACRTGHQPGVEFALSAHLLEQVASEDFRAARWNAEGA